MSDFLVGILAGGVIGIAAATHYPVMAKIVHSLGGDVPTIFVVICQVDETGRVDCKTSDFEKDKKFEL